jgi:hypothetical protein
MSRKNRFFFEKVLVSSNSFLIDPDIFINIIDNESLLFINEGAGAVEISFDGTDVHSELNPSSGTNSLIANYPSVNKIWLRLKSGAASVVRVQNDASIASSTTVNLSGLTVGGTASDFGDPFPVPGTAAGFNDGSDMQGARVYDVDTGVATEYVLGTVLRASAPGGSVEAGTSSKPLRINPTGDTAQPVTDNGGSLTVDTTQLPAALVGGRLDNNVGSWLGSTAPTVGQKTKVNSIPVVVASDQILPISGKIEIESFSNAASDAFGRLRVSAPYTLFESKQIFDNQPLLWDVQLTSGGTSVHSANRASSLLSVTSTVGSKVIRQTKNRFTYQNGKSLLILTTFVMSSNTSGITKRVGYFDSNNGIHLKNNGTTTSLVVRSNVTGSPVEDEVVQDDWNIDVMDGYGVSGKDLDITKAQIFIIDIEWLGVGTVRCGFVIDGVIYYVHKFHHANMIDSVYMSTPNLPIRYEIENVSSGTGSSFEQICCSIISEGGYDDAGLTYSADRGVSPLANVDNNQIYPILSLRLKSGSFGTQILPELIDVFCSSSNANFKWALIINPTINGIDTASWQSLTGSAVEYDVSRTATNYLTGGTVISSGYGSQKTTTLGAIIRGRLALGATIAGVADQLVLGVIKFGGGTDSFAGAITWKEFI